MAPALYFLVAATDQLLLETSASVSPPPHYSSCWPEAPQVALPRRYHPPIHSALPARRGAFDSLACAFPCDLGNFPVGGWELVRGSWVL